MTNRLQIADDTLMEDTLREFFIDAMGEEGVEPDTVETAHWQDTVFDDRNYIIRVGKQINGEMKEFKFAISLTPALTSDSNRLQQEIATAARNIAQEVEDRIIDTIEVGDSYLRFCATDGGWVECVQCGKRLSLRELVRDGPAFSAEAEFSHPSPTPYDIESFLRRLDSGEQEVLKLYMLGALRKQCRCEFGRDNMYEL